MKSTLLALALTWQMTNAVAGDPAAAPQYFRYQRTIVASGDRSGQACAVLDAAVFAHASSESLDDLRLYAQPGTVETPFALSVSGTRSDDDDAATIENLGAQGADIVFDAAMPARSYSNVTLQLAAKDFVGTVAVSGRNSALSPPIALGQFAVFDLTSQRLSRSTTLPLQEVTFPLLHFAVHLRPSPGSDAQSFAPAVVTGLTVPPAREAQTLYTVAAVAPPFTTQGRDSVTIVAIAPHVPIDRVSITPASTYSGNFLRNVTITAVTDGSNDDGGETISGEISHVKITAAKPGEQGSERSDYAIETPFAANLKSAATLHIVVHNGDDPPLPLAPARLEMRQRKICFAAAPGVTAYTLMYGDPALRAPVYDYARLFQPSTTAALLRLGPESPNPGLRQRADTRPFTERHPELLWIVLFAVVALLGSMTLRSARSRSQ